MGKKLLILSFLGICFWIITILWWKQATKPPNPAVSQTSPFVIENEEPIRQIADRLYKENIIRSPVAFFLLARFGGFDEKIQAGNFQLSPSMDLLAVTESLTRGSVDVWIQILEGWRNEEIALVLARDLGIPESAFLKEARQGYMFPDTYLIPKHASASAVVEIFLANFEKKVNPVIAQKVTDSTMTLSDIIIIASLVEREAQKAQDRPLVASVILNRLKLGMKLDIDATIQYALGYQPAEKTWWKKELTLEDLQTASLYNTYLSAGLPPAPIANPGLAAITAVVEAPDTDYLYYIADQTGTSHFATTFEEHQTNITQYLE